MIFNFAKRLVSKVLFSFFLFIALFFSQIQIANSSTVMSNLTPDGIVIEHLRLKVPKEYQQAWLFAEKQSWEPWLLSKRGFLDRKLFWDKKNEEATLLITWSDRQSWKGIPQVEIDNIQIKFEEIARKEIGQDVQNPFPLVFQGELLPQ